MFDRYTETARKAVFFSRYEASQSGSSQIETEHLLLGILRESTGLAQRLPGEAREWVPFLAGYLARCSAAEAETLAQAITAAKAPVEPRTNDRALGASGGPAPDQPPGS